MKAKLEKLKQAVGNVPWNLVGTYGTILTLGLMPAFLTWTLGTLGLLASLLFGGLAAAYFLVVCANRWIELVKDNTTLQVQMWKLEGRLFELETVGEVNEKFAQFEYNQKKAKKKKSKSKKK